MSHVTVFSFFLNNTKATECGFKVIGLNRDTKDGLFKRKEKHTGTLNYLGESGLRIFFLRLESRNQHQQGSSLRSHLHSGQSHNPTNSTNYYLSQWLVHIRGRTRRDVQKKPKKTFSLM